MRVSFHARRFCAVDPRRQILMIPRRMDFKLDFRFTSKVIFGELGKQTSKKAASVEAYKKNGFHRKRFQYAIFARLIFLLRSDGLSRFHLLEPKKKMHKKTFRN